MRAPLLPLLLLLTLPPLAAAAPFPVTATPTQVVLGRDKGVVVQVKAPRGTPPLRAVASTGSLMPLPATARGVYSYRWIPPDIRYPLMAVLAFWVDAAEGPTDGPIGTEFIPNIAGKTVSFVDQGSTSGYLIPALGLIQNGVDPLEDITGIFAGGHPQSVQAVYDGDAEVGVSFNDARGQLVETVPDVGEKVVVFGWSAPIPNDGFAVAGDLPDDLKAAITDALVAYASSEDGAVVMDELYEIDGLVPVPAGSYDIIRDLETELSDLLS